MQFPPRVQDRQPQGAARVDQNFLRRGPTFLYIPTSGARNQAQNFAGPAAVAGNGLRFEARPAGIASRSGTSGGYVRFSGPPLGGGSEYTVLCLIRPDGTQGTTRNPIDADKVSGGLRVFQLRLTSGRAPEFIAFNTGGSAFTATGSTALSLNDDVVMAGRVSGGVASVWLGGRQQASISVTGTARGLGTVAGSELAINAQANGANLFDGSLYLGAYFDFGLSDAELAAVSATPWRIVEPERRIWLPAAVAGGGGSVGLAVEADAALGLTGSMAGAAGLATETDAAQGLSGSISGAAGLATEADSALGLTGSASGLVGLATEADTAQGLSGEQRGAVGLAQEADEAFGLDPASSGPSVGRADETDAALGLTGEMRGSVGLAVEADQALPLFEYVEPPAPEPLPESRGGGGGQMPAQAAQRRRRQQDQQEEEEIALVIALLAEIGVFA